ncbi:uncharacterized protein LOC143275311 [Babylonia areolata]|uniref:uncharacterized protein LOC143275311 n=1 Tax=Babylonia areolata TaxID=304850 RepID=UPI003FD2F667
MGNILRLLLYPWWNASGAEEEMSPEQILFHRLVLRAARAGDVSELQALTEDSNPAAPGAVPLPNVVEALTGRTLLHVAMERRGNADCVAFLVASGCDLHRGDGSGETPLHAACMTDQLENLTAAIKAAEAVGVGEVVNLEVRDVWKRTPLLKAMVYNSQRVLRFLITTRGEDLNLDAQDAFSLSLVHLAVTRQRPDLVRELADRGANLNLLTDKGRSPLSLAITALNPAMVRELLALGASTNVTGSTLPSITAIREFIRRSEGGRELSRPLEEILHLMLAAHGYLLRSDEPDVFQRVLFAADVGRFLPLLHKILVCSDSLSDDLQSRLSSPAPSSPHDARNSGPQPRTALKLFDLARRSARKALMRSGRNVLWAVERLGSNIPPAVKGILLLKDCDVKDFPVQL